MAGFWFVLVFLKLQRWATNEQAIRSLHYSVLLLYSVLIGRILFKKVALVGGYKGREN